MEMRALTSQMDQKIMKTAMMPRTMTVRREPSASSLRIDREKWIDMALWAAVIEAGRTAGPNMWNYVPQ